MKFPAEVRPYGRLAFSKTNGQQDGVGIPIRIEFWERLQSNVGYEASMILDLPTGRALHRFRRLNGIKQGHIAELLGVSQGSVSRWESGTHEPETHHRERIFAMIGARANNDADAALCRLVCSSVMAVHLVCDATHRLLAASPSRVASWAAQADDYIGRSLWPFASPEIMTAEAGLRDRGWFEQPGQRLRFQTGSNGSDLVVVRPSLMEWETVSLADGRIGRLTTTVG